MKTEQTLPDHLCRLRDEIAAAGFSVRAYLVDALNLKKEFEKREVLQVDVSKDDPRFFFNHDRIQVTPIVAQLGPQSMAVTNPSGFYFNVKDSGDFTVSASVRPDIKERVDLVEFAACFTNPSHPDGKIRGPMSMPAQQRVEIRKAMMAELEMSGTKSAKAAAPRP